jgi:DNA (cytosine-5)-methyltransferase 1
VSGLVLSIFPGIGMLDMAFEEEGFVIVRGPDKLWGGDVKRFHPPAGRFDGLIGGDPCQGHSSLAHLNRAQGAAVEEDYTPEFERVVAAAQPAWFVRENSPFAPVPAPAGYIVTSEILCDHWVGGETSRRLPSDRRGSRW